MRSILLATILAAVLRAAADTKATVPPACTGTTVAADAATADTNGSTFVFAPGHFSFHLPYYWTMVPDEKLELYKDTLRKQFPGRSIPNYVLAIQRKSLFSLSLPYAIVELDNRMMPTPEQVESDRKAFADSVIKAYLPLHRDGQFGEVKPMEAAYDTNKHVIVGYWQMVRGYDNQRLVCVSAMYPCGYGYARVHFFMDENDQDKYFPVIDRIIGSVSFDQGFAYNPPPAIGKKEQSLRNMRTTIFVLVATMVVWLGIRILLRTWTVKPPRPRPTFLGKP